MFSGRNRETVYPPSEDYYERGIPMGPDG